MATEKASSGMVARENIGTEIPSRDARIGRLLDEGPPVGLQQNLVSEPVRDGLLCDARMSDLAHLGRERFLAPAANLDGPLQSSNVTLLHGHPKYTNGFVNATTPFVRQNHKGACNVLDMPQSKSAALRRPVRPAKPLKEKRQALPGPDGKTLGHRVSEAMAYKAGRLGREYRPVDLLTDINKLSHAPVAEPILTQQMLSAILKNKVTQTSKTPFIAMACGVNAVWMSHGIGKMTD